jgi:hypothetical protein
MDDATGWIEQWKAVCRRLRRSVGALLLAVLVGCVPSDPPEDTSDPKGSTAVSMRGYNYTAEGVQVFYVNDARVSNLPPNGGGGKDSCCAMLPDQWHEGLAVRVDWTIGHYTVPWAQRERMTVAEERQCCWSERTLQQIVPVQRYDSPSTLQVFFLPDDKLEVWVTKYDLGHPEHPSGRSYPVKPTQPISSSSTSTPQPGKDTP